MVAPPFSAISAVSRTRISYLYGAGSSPRPCCSSGVIGRWTSAADESGEPVGPRRVAVVIDGRTGRGLVDPVLHVLHVEQVQVGAEPVGEVPCPRRDVRVRERDEGDAGVAGPVVDTDLVDVADVGHAALLVDDGVADADTGAEILGDRRPVALESRVAVEDGGLEVVEFALECRDLLVTEQCHDGVLSGTWVMGTACADTLRFKCSTGTCLLE